MRSCQRSTLDYTVQLLYHCVCVCVQSLLDKEGAVQCRHSRENGKLVPLVKKLVSPYTVIIVKNLAV